MRLIGRSVLFRKEFSEQAPGRALVSEQVKWESRLRIKIAVDEFILVPTGEITAAADVTETAGAAFFPA